VASDRELRVTRLSANPLGAPVPDGERGDIVKVSDGTTSIYLLPSEYESLGPGRLAYEFYRRVAQRKRAAG
jgi:ribosomal protein L9